MASPSPIFLPSLFLLSFLSHFSPIQGGGLIFEDGYTVSTVLDGDKSNIKLNPHSIISQSPPSDHFVLLDSVSSTFYTVSFFTASNETLVQKLAGNGEHSYVDGDLKSARFNKPRSFAVDYNGNLYVADQRNHAIRKITKSGVTTIAGGYSQKAGRTDGPARGASFSDDFELTFIAERCALMISDHGNRLVRQINLKAEDCARHSGSALGTTSAWLLVVGVGFSLLLGIIIGFVMRPLVTQHEVFRPLPNCWTWKHCLMRVGRQTVMLCSDIRNAVVKSSLYSLVRQPIILSFSHLSLMFSIRMVESRTSFEKQASLIDSDAVSNRNTSISPVVYDQLKDLITFGGGFETSGVPEDKGEITDLSPISEVRDIDTMMQLNLINFEEDAQTLVGYSLGLAKRR